MKFTSAVAVAILSFSSIIEAAPAMVDRRDDDLLTTVGNPDEVLPDRPMNPGTVSGLIDRRDEDLLTTVINTDEVLPDRPMNPGTVSGLIDRRDEDLLTTAIDTGEELPARPMNPGTVSGLIDRRANKPPVEDFREPDYQTRVLAFDRLNEAERLRQVASMKVENPSMKVRQQDIDRFTKYMVSDALSTTEEEFCAIVVKTGIKEFEMVQEPKKYWYPMCQAKYKEYNSWWTEHENDPYKLEAKLEKQWHKQLEWNHDDWVRIAEEDREQTSREAAEAEAKERFADLIEETMPGSITKRSEQVEKDEDTPIEPKMSKWTKLTNDLSSAIGVELRKVFGQD